jgi:hypothetical protein
MTSVAQKKSLPHVNGDFYHISESLSEEDQALLLRVRAFMEPEVTPIINQYWARELLAGNGILLEHQVGRFVADAEATYSYEGTREMNTLIVGRAITGFSEFV